MSEVISETRIIALAIYEALNGAAEKTSYIEPPNSEKSSVIDGRFDYDAVAEALQEILKEQNRRIINDAPECPTKP